MPLTLHWEPLPSTPALQRSSQTLTTLPPSSVYIFGGELQPRQPVDSHLHHISLSPSPTITTLPATSPPTPRVGTASTRLSNTLYLFSGRGGLDMAPLSDGPGALLAIDLSATRPAWQTLLPADPDAPVPEARSYHAMTSDTKGRLYLHAGCPEKGRLGDFWAFETSGRKWVRLADAPGKPRGGTSLAFAAGKVWRFGGFDGEKEVGGQVDWFDVDEGRWGSVEFEADGVKGPKARSVSALLPVKVGGREMLVSVFGEGEASSLGHAGAGKFFGDAWAFDIEEKKWAELKQEGQRPEPRGWFAADVLSEDQGVVQGGLGGDNERLGDLWRFTIKEE